jgi:E3 SUMO-protein ligase PIAS1
MFNPVLNNELTMTWSYRQDNKDLHIQYVNAQYALHIFLVEHLTVEELCEQIKNKTARFYRDDLVKLLAKAIETDRDLGLEVSDQKLKLKCPIDQRLLKIPIRAITCQHLQCFDLTNYIGKNICLEFSHLNFLFSSALNEKAGKWICPVCNKSALFDDLQIDAYTESIINAIENEDITEITIDSQLNWTPVTAASLIIEQQQIRLNIDDIILDDDPMDDQHEYIDSKLSIPLIPSSTNELTDVILIDDD